MRNRSVAPVIHSAAPQRPLAQNLIAIVQIVHGVENRIAVLNLHNRPVRKDQSHALHEAVPFVLIPEVVHHQETATQEIVANLPGLRLGQLPVAPLAPHHPRPIEDFVSPPLIPSLFHPPPLPPSPPPHPHPNT